MRSIRAAVAAAAVALATAPPAVALAGPSAAGRDAARGLAGKGYELFEAGNYARAIEFFQQAEARYHAPPHLLYIARAQVKLGKLLEAEETYQRVIDEQLAADAPAPFKEAQTSARAERTEAQILVPSVVIDLEGDVPSGTRVLLDGAPLEPKALGKPMRQNPGTHIVTAEPPGMPPIGRTVVLKLGGGEDTHVALQFPKTSGSIVPGVICFSVGVAGLGVGVTTAILGVHAAPEDATKIRIAEITGFAVGGAAVVAGIVLTIVRPRIGGAPQAAPAAQIGPLRDVRVGFGPTSFELAGRF